MDLKQIFGLVKLPLAVLIILDMLSNGFTIFVYATTDFTSPTYTQELATNPMLFFGGLVLLLLSIFVLIWAGYRVAKRTGEILGGAVGGLIISLISSFISGLVYILIVAPFYTSQTGIGSLGLNNIFGILQVIALVIGLVVAAIGGFVFGAIGGFFGKRKAQKSFTEAQ